MNFLQIASKSDNPMFKLVNKLDLSYLFDWIFMIFDQNLAIYTVFYKESESEVKKCQILDPGGKNQEIRILENLFFKF